MTENNLLIITGGVLGALFLTMVTIFNVGHDQRLREAYQLNMACRMKYGSNPLVRISDVCGAPILKP